MHNRKEKEREQAHIFRRFPCPSVYKFVRLLTCFLCSVHFCFQIPEHYQQVILAHKGYWRNVSSSWLFPRRLTYNSSHKISEASITLQRSQFPWERIYVVAKGFQKCNPFHSMISHFIISLFWRRFQIFPGFTFWLKKLFVDYPVFLETDCLDHAFKKNFIKQPSISKMFFKRILAI